MSCVCFYKVRYIVMILLFWDDFNVIFTESTETQVQTVRDDAAIVHLPTEQRCADGHQMCAEVTAPVQAQTAVSAVEHRHTENFHMSQEGTDDFANDIGNMVQATNGTGRNFAEGPEFERISEVSVIKESRCAVFTLRISCAVL